MKFYILGAGAIGSIYGAGLRQAGFDVTLIIRNAVQLRAIRKNGLSVVYGSLDEDAPDHFEDIIQIDAHRAENCEEPADYLFVFTKSTGSEAALESVRHLITPDTVLISLQNGLGNDDILRKFASDEDHLIIGMTTFAVDRVGDRRIHAVGRGGTTMMTASGRVTEAAQVLEQVLDAANLEPNLTPEVWKAIWEKVAFNSALNTLTAITLLPLGHMGKTAEGKELAHEMVREVISVARAKGVPADEARVLGIVDRLMVEHFDHLSSMLQDVLRGRETEIAFINGAVVREAGKLGMRVPVTETLYKLMCIYQQTYEWRMRPE